MGSIPNFQPFEIVCLEYENTCLYAEVIQIVTSRQVCWVRPLMLKQQMLTDSMVEEDLTLYDLRQDSDLLWPISLFRSALDTEVIPLLMQLNSLDASSGDKASAPQKMRYFIRQVWQAHQNQFQET